MTGKCKLGLYSIDVSTYQVTMDMSGRQSARISHPDGASDMTTDLIDQALDCDRQLKAAKTDAEMKQAIARRRLVRAEMDFQRSIDAYDAANPIGNFAESFRVIH